MGLRTGSTLDDRYTLIERLGQGGQGTVWKAFDKNTGENRALKVVDIGGGDEDAVRRAQREARLVCDVRHPALVRCHSVVTIPTEDLLILVFDFVTATPLSAAQSDARFTGVHKRAALRHIAGALAHLHRIGVVHRDLKPDNILVTERFWDDPAAPSSLKIIDFGIAAPRRGEGGATLSGRFGTPAYMAPELFDVPDIDEQRSPARDVFAFGVIGWELLCGGHPTELGSGARAAVYRTSYEHARRSRDPWPRRTLSGPWGAAIARCLALDPADRPADGSAILGLLGEPAETPPPGPAAPSAGKASGASRPGSTEPHQAPVSLPPEPRAKPAPRVISVDPTVRKEPSAAVFITMPAPKASLPRPSALDRTTPMPPEAGEVEEEGEEKGEERAGSAPGQEPAPATKQGGSRIWPVLAVIAAVAGIGGGAVFLMSRGVEGSGAATVPTSRVDALVLASASGVPSVSASPAPVVPSAPSASASPSVAPVKVCCGAGKDRCPSKRVCEPGDCKHDVPEREFLLRVFDVKEGFEGYGDEHSLTGRKEFRDSQLCLERLRTPSNAGHICIPMQSVPGNRTSRSALLPVRTSDIKKTGIRFVIKRKDGQEIKATMIGSVKLLSSALCSSFSMADKDHRYSIVFYLDDVDDP